MLAILAVAAGVATAGALAWRKVLLPMDRMLELSDELSESEWTSAPRPGPFETSIGLANLAAATGTAAPFAPEAQMPVSETAGGTPDEMPAKRQA
jgi:hypothetical protein